jgi:hypothetical protein
MPEIGTSGLMSGEGKRSICLTAAPPRLSSTLPAKPGLQATEFQRAADPGYSTVLTIGAKARKDAGDGRLAAE